MKPHEISFQDYMEELKYKIAFYGFTYCPLNVGEIFQCHKQGLSLDEAYNVACDADALHPYFDLQESIDANKGVYQ